MVLLTTTKILFGKQCEIKYMVLFYLLLLINFKKQKLVENNLNLLNGQFYLQSYFSLKLD